MDNKRLLEVLVQPNPLQCSDPGCKRCLMYDVQQDLAVKWLNEERYCDEDFVRKFFVAVTDEWVKAGLIKVE